MSGGIRFLFIRFIVTVVRQGLLRLQTLDLRACRRVGNKGVGHFVAAYAAPPLILRPRLCSLSYIATQVQKAHIETAALGYKPRPRWPGFHQRLCRLFTGRDLHAPRVSRPARLQWLDHGQRAYGKVQVEEPAAPCAAALCGTAALCMRQCRENLIHAAYARYYMKLPGAEISAFRVRFDRFYVIFKQNKYCCARAMREEEQRFTEG